MSDLINGICPVCHRPEELRPYGKGGSNICFDCAMATPEAKAEAERQVNRRFKSAGRVAVIDGLGPPRAATPEERAIAALALTPKGTKQ